MSNERGRRADDGVDGDDVEESSKDFLELWEKHLGPHHTRHTLGYTKDPADTRT